MLIPDDNPTIITSAQVVAYEKIPLDKKKVWDDREEFAEAAIELWKGDLIYVPKSIFPQIVERITQRWMGPEVEKMARTNKNLKLAVLTVAGQDVPAKDADFIEGPYITIGDLVVWVRETNLVEEIMDKVPVDNAIVLEVRPATHPDLIVARSPWEFKEQYNYKIQINDGRQFWVPGAELKDTKDVEEFWVTLEEDWIRPNDVLYYYPIVDGEKKNPEYGRVTGVYQVHKLYTDSLTVPDSSVFAPINMVHMKDLPGSGFDIYSEGKEGDEDVREKVLGINVIRKHIIPTPDGIPRGPPRPVVPSQAIAPMHQMPTGPLFRHAEYGTPIPEIPPIPTEMTPDLAEKQQRFRQIAMAAQPLPPVPPKPPEPTEFTDITVVEKKKEK